jgi:hypothetical protein
MYALPDCVLHAFGNVLCHGTGPFTLGRSYALLAARLVCVVAAIAATRAWPLLLCPEAAAQVASLLLSLALVARRERRMRARYARLRDLAAKQKTA